MVLTIEASLGLGLKPMHRGTQFIQKDFFPWNERVSEGDARAFEGIVEAVTTACPSVPLLPPPDRAPGVPLSAWHWSLEAASMAPSLNDCLAFQARGGLCINAKSPIKKNSFECHH